MTPEEYNIREIQNGNFTQIMLARLVEFWQGTHSLEPDGKCGPNTQQSIIDSIFEDDGDIGPLAAAALDVARREIGHGEEGGNNSGQFVAKYHRIEDDGDDDDDGSWCAAFVSYCFEEGQKHSVSRCRSKEAVAPRNSSATSQSAAKQSKIQNPETSSAGTEARQAPGKDTSASLNRQPMAYYTQSKETSEHTQRKLNA